MILKVMTSVSVVFFLLHPAYLLPVLMKSLTEFPLFVAAAVPPSPTTIAVNMALLPPVQKEKKQRPERMAN